MIVASTAATGALRLGTRGSPLALAQARQVRDLLAAAHPDMAAPEIVEISTKGDRTQHQLLRDIGGKGLFTREIEDGLRDGGIDIAVHSMKDMPTVLPDGLVIDCVLTREDPRDVLCTQDPADAARGLAGLKPNAVVGTASLRRGAQVLAARPDVEIVAFRGNVGTRLEKLAAGTVDATLLAAAGLNRLGIGVAPHHLLTVEEMLPAAAQGAVGIERRAGDERVAGLLAPLNDVATMRCVVAERALLEALDGSCRTPIGALAVLDGTQLTLEALVLSPDGQHVYRTTRHGGADDGAHLGRDAGAQLRTAAGPAFFVALAEI